MPVNMGSRKEIILQKFEYIVVRDGTVLTMKGKPVYSAHIGIYGTLRFTMKTASCEGKMFLFSNMGTRN